MTTATLLAGLSLADALPETLPLALAVVFAAGFLTCFTPCVYPLIPVTVSVFGARRAGTRAEAALVSALYVLGMALTYSSLGVGAALTGAVFGRFMADPWVVGAVALVFAVFAASMFGAFEVALPAGVQARLGRVGGKGRLGALAMGLCAGLIAAPCTGPVLGGVLAYVATTGRALSGFALLFAFAIGMGLPFFAIGAFAVKLPKSGPWLLGIKSVFGVALLATALYFAKDAIPVLKAPLRHEASFIIGALILAGVGVLLGAIHRSFHGSAGDRLRKAVGVACAVLGLYGAVGAFAMPRPARLPWLAADEGLARARAEGKPALVDFSADWCAACKEFESLTYPDPLFVEESRHFVLVKVDATRGGAKVDALTDRFRVKGLPAIVFVTPAGEILDEPRVQGFLRAREIVALMRDVRERKTAGARAPVTAARAATGDRYVLDATVPGEVRVGEEAVVRLVVRPKFPYKMNGEFPIKLSTKADAAVTLPRPLQGRADAKRFQHEVAEMHVPFRVTAVGQHRIEADFRFAVCTSTDCLPQKEKTAWSVRAIP